MSLSPQSPSVTQHPAIAAFEHAPVRALQESTVHGFVSAQPASFAQQAATAV